MKRVLKVYDDGQEEIVIIPDPRELNWPLIAGLSFTLAFWVVVIGLFS